MELPENVAVRVVVACGDCGVHWYARAEAPRCTSTEHEHLRVDVHCHRSPVRLPDGTEVMAVSFDALDPYGRDRPPDYGLYLDPRWQPPWPHDLLDWPDFGVPDGGPAVRRALRSVLARARGGERVEVGCLGGHGRTGTVLACLAVLAGQPAGEAVGWARAHYCAAAVETADQEAFVAAFGA